MCKKNLPKNYTHIPRELAKKAQLSLENDLFLQEEGKHAMESILRAMEGYVKALVFSKYDALYLGSDQAYSKDDLLSFLNSQIVDSIYRYKVDGKYEVFNYLARVLQLGVIKVHSSRNYAKRKLNSLKHSLDAIRYRDDEGCTLLDKIASYDPEKSDLYSAEFEDLFDQITFTNEKGKVISLRDVLEAKMRHDTHVCQRVINSSIGLSKWGWDKMRADLLEHLKDKYEKC